jgi:hypothetical protein
MARTPQPKRTLKVCYGFHWKSNKKHPVINLGGHYLAQFDFKIGDFVEMTIENGQITIRKASQVS